MKRKILAALAGAALALTAGSTAAAAPADPRSVTAERGSPGGKWTVSHDSHLYEPATAEFTAAYETFADSYNLGVVLGDDLVESDPDASLMGFSFQREALLAFDTALREIEWPQEMLPDVSAYLTALADVITVLDQIGQVEYVEDLEALYDGELQTARTTHQEALDVVLSDLGLERVEETPAPEEGAPADPQASTEKPDWGTGGDRITDAKTVAEELRDAIDLGTAPYVDGGNAFPAEWIPLTHKWEFIGSGYAPDEDTIVGSNAIVTSKTRGVGYFGVVIKDAEGGCEALVVDYGEEGDVSRLVAGKEVPGECNYQNGMETLGY